MAEDAPPLLRVEGLRAGYGALSVLRGISLTVRQGETAALLGPNGHGKTTLLRALSGLLAKSSGDMWFLGRSMAAASAAERRRMGIAHVPQGDLLFTEMSVHENLLAGAFAGPAWRDRHAHADECYAIFPELALRRRSAAGLLSGGERRMLSIARAIMAPSRLLLVDEPSIGLSPGAIRRVYDALARLRRGGATILIVEETLERVQGFADLVHLIDRGELVATATPAEIRGNERLLRTYLG